MLAAIKHTQQDLGTAFIQGISVLLRRSNDAYFLVWIVLQGAAPILLCACIMTIKGIELN